MQDDLKHLTDEINSAQWDEENDMTRYDVESMSTYLGHQDTIFLTCHEMANAEKTLVGIASARIQIKPYARERWLYVDEIDVCADQRRQGAGYAMMKKLFEIAALSACKEVWLGAESGNKAANALYRSLDPDDVATFLGFTYELDD